MTYKNLYFSTLLILGVLFIGCSKEESEPTYSVWTKSISYSNYPGTIDDGSYIQVELSNTDFNDISATLSSQNKNNWTEEQIYNWFLGRDFIPIEATQKTAWLTTTNHCMLTTRTGNTVYRIIK